MLFRSRKNKIKRKKPRKKRHKKKQKSVETSESEETLRKKMYRQLLNETIKLKEQNKINSEGENPNK